MRQKSHSVWLLIDVQYFAGWGFNNTEIAKKLKVSRQTVQEYVAELRRVYRRRKKDGLLR